MGEVAFYYLLLLVAAGGLSLLLGPLSGVLSYRAYRVVAERFAPGLHLGWRRGRLRLSGLLDGLKVGVRPEGVGTVYRFGRQGEIPADVAWLNNGLRRGPWARSELGDPAFDKAFYLPRSTPVARALLDAVTRAQLLRLSERFAVGITRGVLVLRERFPHLAEELELGIREGAQLA